MPHINPVIEESWKQVLADEFNKPYFSDLKTFLQEEKKHYRIFPEGKNIFAAFNLCPFEQVKVVILGQDPYHGYGQAHGLCFSVPQGIPAPPSLVNIFKEIASDLETEIPKCTDLSHWAKQGVLLLNAILTVREGQAGSHQNKGWEEFTDRVIQKLSEQKEGLVFLLWGKFAQSKATLIDASKHFILKAAHPSPLSAYNGFMGCKHFSKTNNILIQQGKPPIKWIQDN